MTYIPHFMKGYPVGQTAEQTTMDRLGARRVRGSGSLREKSDGILGRHRIENKATEKQSFSVKYGVLRKISEEARGSNQSPVLTFQFIENGAPRVYGRWVCIPEDEYVRLIENER